MEVITLMLMLWIQNHTTYDIANIPAPDIIELSAIALTKEAYADNPDKIPENGIDKRIYALYSDVDGPNGTIYLTYAAFTKGSEKYSDPINNPIFQERILHELIHHTQKYSGVFETIPCRNLSEKEAYILGGIFLKQHQVKDPIPNRYYFANRYSRC